MFRLCKNLRFLSTSSKYDVIVIGSGPGGYVAAIRAAQFGLRTACIEKDVSLGGTCLNIGCIPSKSLLHNSYLYSLAKTGFGDKGIMANVQLDLGKMMRSKDRVVKELNRGIEGLFRKNQVDRIMGTATILDRNQVRVTSSRDVRVYESKNIVIATGSIPTRIPALEINEIDIVSSTGALSLAKVPSKLVVVGGGVIGLELGSVWSRLGSQVTVVEYFDRIGVGMDRQISLQLEKALSSQGITFRLGTKVSRLEKASNGGHIVHLESKSGPSNIHADVVLVSVGRTPNTQGLGLDQLGIKTDKGRIVTDEQFRSSIREIRAIGDVIAGPMLAHKAEEEGLAVAGFLANKPHSLNYDSIPSVVYTHPEVAWVGKTEEELANKEYTVGKFPFSANGRAKTMGDATGMVKILSCKNTGSLLGAHIIGPGAGDMIIEAVMAIKLGLKTADIGSVCHPHPSLGEAFKEACMSTPDSKPVHV